MAVASPWWSATPVAISYRPITLVDVDDIVGVLCAVVDDPGMADDFRHDALEQARGEIPDSTTYVILSDGRKIGRLRVVRTTGCLEIAGLQIHPDWQGRGAGTAVINSILREGKSVGLPVELNVDQENLGAQRLYARLGFERIATAGRDYRMRCLDTTS